MSKPSWFDGRVTMGNVLTMIVMVGSLIMGYATLATSVSSSAEAVKSIPAIEGRVSTIETRINLGQAAREQFQAETRQALKEQAASINQMLQLQAAIIARMDEAEKRR